MSTWTHNICDDCWAKREPGRLAHRLCEAGMTTCCFCGKPTKGGIYVREDPTKLKCGGNCKQ